MIIQMETMEWSNFKLTRDLDRISSMIRESFKRKNARFHHVISEDLVIRNILWSDLF